jgi:hypothetical protein
LNICTNQFKIVSPAPSAKSKPNTAMKVPLVGCLPSYAKCMSQALEDQE